MTWKRFDGYADLRTEQDFEGFTVKPKLTKTREVIRLDHEKDWDFEGRVNRRLEELEDMIRADYVSPVTRRGRAIFNHERTRATVTVHLLKGELKEELK